MSDDANPWTARVGDLLPVEIDVLISRLKLGGLSAAEKKQLATFLAGLPISSYQDLDHVVVVAAELRQIFDAADIPQSTLSELRPPKVFQQAFSGVPFDELELPKRKKQSDPTKVVLSERQLAATLARMMIARQRRPKAPVKQAAGGISGVVGRAIDSAIQMASAELPAASLRDPLVELASRVGRPRKPGRPHAYKKK